ncbi:hypothetical protein IMSHALPRED_002016 [Imshaugia aleurites]|uniref:C2H2-type domain-containing protein n=1 Tax=Imshaugia aleurites TaxID=172621 RepID=A0A8H3J484_9LECA|nr:hypothetical protein IMSHALPRED_002016 [Imshaugia aleurites]
MNQTRENISFINPWSARSAVEDDQLLSCLDGQCQLEFPNSDRRYEHYVASHPYWKPSLNEDKPLKCRLCQKTYKFERRLKLHIKHKHKPIRRDPTVTQEDQEILISQSHVPTADKKRSEAEQNNENVQDHHIEHEDEGPEEQPHFAHSRRNSLLDNEVMQYIKRKGSQIIAPLAKKVRKPSTFKPHGATSAVTGVMKEGQSTDLERIKRCRRSRLQTGGAISAFSQGQAKGG